jgi:hypothetical protein
MLHRLRRKLRQIQYYSAQRKRTAWSRATDIALLSALLVAPLCAWASNTLLRQQAVRTELVGRTMTDPADRTIADVVARQDMSLPWPNGMTPISEFRLTQIVEDRGWPVTTTRIVHAPQIDLTLILDQTTTADIAHDPADAQALAIDRALRHEGHETFADAWMAGATDRRTHALGWVFSSVLWCGMLWIGLLIAINLARLFAFALSARRQVQGARLRGRNRCAHCGYDLRGLEFNERCPECGRLSW